MSDKKALLILNGSLDLSKKKIDILLQKNKIDKIIAVDGGSNKARILALIPDLIIGDLDSVSKTNLEYFKTKKVDIIKHPVEKDQTDSELAVDYCLKNNFSKLYLTAALGGRIDQQLANLNLLEYIYRKNIEAQIIAEDLEIALIAEKKVFKGKKGWRLSLIPQTFKVENLTIRGCKYNLEEKNIERAKSRGISNLIEAEKAEITISGGLLIYVLEKLKQ